MHIELTRQQKVSNIYNTIIGAAHWINCRQSCDRICIALNHSAQLSVGMSRCSAIRIFLSVWLGGVSGSSPNQALKCCSQFAFRFSADPPYILGSGLDLRPDCSFIVTQAVVCFFSACCLDMLSILPWMYSASVCAYASSSVSSLLLLVCLCTVTYLSANPYGAFFTRAKGIERLFFHLSFLWRMRPLPWTASVGCILFRFHLKVQITHQNDIILWR